MIEKICARCGELFRTNEPFITCYDCQQPLKELPERIRTMPVVDPCARVAYQMLRGRWSANPKPAGRKRD